MKPKIKELSPMMKRYVLMKEKYKDSILFYRLGDFYEMFFEDAVEVSKALDLALTSKSCGLDEKAPMCGVPYHAAETYIGKLISLGYKVAICEQVGEQVGKELMVREIDRIITPGTITDENMLEKNKNNYLLSIYKSSEKIGVSYVDITTGEFCAVPIGKSPESEISDLLVRICPSEVIGNEAAGEFYNALPLRNLGTLPKFSKYFEWAYSLNRANENLETQLGGNYIQKFELEKYNELVISSGAIIEYLNETQKRSLQNINSLKVVKNAKFLVIDANTRRNLELVETTRERRRQGSLLFLMDKTKTNMGGRKLRKYFDEPLQDVKEINARLDGVDELVKKIILRDKISDVLSQVRDIERLSGKIAYGNVNPKELIALKISLGVIPQLREALKDVASEKLVCCREKMYDFSQIVDLLERAIQPNPPAVLKEGGYIKKGFNDELDNYRDAKKNAAEWLEKLEAKERELTGIKNLKIGMNKVFGYYIEVNRSQIENVPIRYERKQTISNNERYITEDLKELEETIFGSEEKAIKLEGVLYNQIKQYLLGFVKSFQEVADGISELDAILSFAVCAVKYNFCKPKINNSIKEIKIEEGRHPVVEAYQSKGTFIANDTFLNSTTDRTMIITGPNMAGKSTYMRQVAIITFLAHIGSFVPAKSADIALTDRIFTRVGASDDLAFGQSTFMVEMSEVATILANATNRSLIVLDEIGRGTSTFDGLSIAWAVVEYISNHYKAKTLFATHYHELTELEGVLEGVKNYKIAVKELEDSVIFLRKIIRGGANKSFGIEVARLAGVPQIVLDRAKEISKNLEAVNTSLDLNIFKEKRQKAEVNSKLAVELLTQIKDLNMNNISPMHAFDLLNDLVTKAKQGEGK